MSSQADAPNVNLIPRPPNTLRKNLQASMGLEERPGFYREILTSMRNIAVETLDMDKTHSTQKPGAWSQYLERVVEAVPFLRRFDNAWPVVIYMKALLATRACNNARHRAKTQGAPTKIKKQVLDKASVTGPPTQTGAALMEKGAEGGRVTSLRALLHSFNPPLGDLLRPLRRAGLYSAEDLLKMMKWSEGERRAFMRDDIKLNAFQAKQLDIALSGLCTL